jgi:Icc-related predicted phosphoesterase
MRIYYATDVHGSEKCWRKFIITPKYYNADVIIMGGDITGKFIVPIIQLHNGRFEATFMGRKRRMKKQTDVDKLKELIANTGQYAVDVTPEEYEQYNEDPSLLDKLFEELLLKRLERWLEMAEEKLRGQNVRCFVSGGNDDLFEVDEVLAKSEVIENHDGRVVDLGDGFELLGLGYSNITPWNCPRDITEEELAEKIENVADQVNRLDRAIFDIHVPPHGTGIDEAPELTEDMQMVMGPAGEPNVIPVGSTAVREAILKYQPMLGLHGHIHESSGIRKLGKTTLVNPGSEYAEGILRGALIEVEAEEGLVNVNLVSG